MLKKMIMPLADKVMNTKIMHYYDQIMIMQKLTKSDIKEWQDKKQAHVWKDNVHSAEYTKRGSLGWCVDGGF